MKVIYLIIYSNLVGEIGSIVDDVWYYKTTDSK
jgi:hypothetical protein